MARPAPLPPVHVTCKPDCTSTRPSAAMKPVVANSLDTDCQSPTMKRGPANWPSRAPTCESNLRLRPPNSSPVTM
eukprot:2858211-Pyramimonas_sp.AAC.1